MLIWHDFQSTIIPSIYDKRKYDYEITLESVLEINQYYSIMVKSRARENNGNCMFVFPEEDSEYFFY